VLIMEMEGGAGGLEVHRVDGLGVCWISGISTGELEMCQGAL
jgi:hypothetical protein